MPANPAQFIPFGFITILLLLVPGLLGLDLYYRYSNQKSTLSRTQILVYSALVSLSSISILYVLSGLYFGYLTETAHVFAQFANLVTQEDLQEIRFSDLFSLYIAHVVVVALLGITTGAIIQRYTEYKDPREPWQYAFTVSPSDGEEIEVVLDNGTVLRGDFNRKSWDPDARELYLDKPDEVRYSEEGDEIDSRTSLGRSILIAEDAIRQVIFVEEDPQFEDYTISVPVEVDEDLRELLDTIDGFYSTDYEDES